MSVISHLEPVNVFAFLNSFQQFPMVRAIVRLLHVGLKNLHKAATLNVIEILSTTL